MTNAARAMGAGAAFGKILGEQIHALPGGQWPRQQQQGSI